MKTALSCCRASRDSAMSHPAPKETCRSQRASPASGTPIPGVQQGARTRGVWWAKREGGAGPQISSWGLGQGVTAACVAFTPSPGAGVASKLGGSCFSTANTSSWGQFTGILSPSSSREEPQG